MSVKTGLVALGLTLVWMTGTHRAHAQSATPAPASPTAPDASAAATSSSTPPQAGAPAEPPAEPEEFKARFRWGIWVEGGPYFFSGSSGGVGGISVRLGAQITEEIGVYAQPIALLGGGASVGPNGASASALVVGGAAAMVNLTLADHFFIAAGPEMLDGTAGATSASSTSASASAASGAFFSIDARAGFALGKVKPNRRRGFSIGGDLHMIFTPGGTVVVPLIGLGYDAL